MARWRLPSVLFQKQPADLIGGQCWCPCYRHDLLRLARQSPIYNTRKLQSVACLGRALANRFIKAEPADDKTNRGLGEVVGGIFVISVINMSSYERLHLFPPLFWLQGKRGTAVWHHRTTEGLTGAWLCLMWLKKVLSKILTHGEVKSFFLFFLSFILNLFLFFSILVSRYSFAEASSMLYYLLQLCQGCSYDLSPPSLLLFSQADTSTSLLATLLCHQPSISRQT